jgi:hypothetical protein
MSGLGDRELKMPTHHLLIRDIYPKTLSLLQRIYRYSAIIRCANVPTASF